LGRAFGSAPFFQIWSRKMLSWPDWRPGNSGFGGKWWAASLLRATSFVGDERAKS